MFCHLGCRLKTSRQFLLCCEKLFKSVRLSVFHAAAQEEAKELAKRLQDQFGPLEIIPSLVSPVIGAHVGPGTLSIAYMAG